MSNDIHKRVARKILEEVFGVTAHTKTLDFTTDLLQREYGDQYILLRSAKMLAEDYRIQNEEFRAKLAKARDALKKALRHLPWGSDSRTDLIQAIKEIEP